MQKENVPQPLLPVGVKLKTKKYYGKKLFDIRKIYFKVIKGFYNNHHLIYENNLSK